MYVLDQYTVSYQTDIVLCLSSMGIVELIDLFSCYICYINQFIGKIAIKPHQYLKWSHQLLIISNSAVNNANHCFEYFSESFGPNSIKVACFMHI